MRVPLSTILGHKSYDIDVRRFKVNCVVIPIIILLEVWCVSFTHNHWLAALYGSYIGWFGYQLLDSALDYIAFRAWSKQQKEIHQLNKMMER